MMNGIKEHGSSRGFTMVEILIGMLISSVILTGIYRMWLSSSEESLKLRKKIEMRNQIALSTKQLQKAITLAGYGMQGVSNLEKKDGVGTDTLIIYSNQSNHETSLQTKYSLGHDHLNVLDPSIFSGATHVAVRDANGGEFRKIHWKNSNNIGLSEPLTKDYEVASSVVMPVFHEKYYTDQENQKMMRISGGSARILGHSLTNFQVAFKDKDGNSTSTVNTIRSVTFSFTGVFPAKAGAINNINFTSTAIPRNLI